MFWFFFFTVHFLFILLWLIYVYLLLCFLVILTSLQVCWWNHWKPFLLSFYFISNSAIWFFLIRSISMLSSLIWSYILTHLVLHTVTFSTGNFNILIIIILNSYQRTAKSVASLSFISLLGMCYILLFHLFQNILLK